MKRYDNITFIRYGNMNPCKHKEGRLGSDSEERSFHTAPCFKGIYAFPRGLVEPYLLSGRYGILANRFIYFRDCNGNKVSERDFYEEDWKTPRKEYRDFISKNHIKHRRINSEYDDSAEDCYMYYDVEPHYFKYVGDIWHHLGCYVEKTDIITEKGAWTKTSYKVYTEALNKSITLDRFNAYMESNDRHGNPHSHPLWTSLDCYEVFIEKVK